MVRLSSALALLALPLGIVASKKGCEPEDPLLRRPHIDVGPYTTGKRFPHSPLRNPQKICRVKGDGVKDNSKDILHALHKCNHGGIVALEGQLVVGKALDLTFLKHIDVAILGTINFTDDVDYWLANSFHYPFQNSITFWRWGGEDVNIFGHGIGEINGNGQLWYNMFHTNSTLLRPILFVTDGLHGASISGLRLKNPPMWFNLYNNSTDMVVSDMDLQAVSNNATVLPKNTDGWDTLRCSNIIIQNSVINNGDDCVSFKPNSTSMVVQNLNCNGSHGISVGSLGQYIGEVDIAEDLYIYNVSMSNASDGARLKVWPGRAPGSTATDAGGGLGHIRNVTYELFQIQNDDYAIEINQCYNQNDFQACQKNPSKLVMEDIFFKDFSGVASAKYDPQVGRLVCSSPEVCINIQASNINVQPPSGKTAVWTCAGFDTSKLDMNCQPPSQG